MLTPFDWILAAVLVVALPLFAAWSYPRFRRRVAAGRPHARVREYRHTLGMEWILVAVTALLWFTQGRDPASLGLGLDFSLGFWIAAAVTAVLIVLLLLNNRAILRDPEKRRELLESLGKVTDLLPRSRPERRWFAALSITAGICEEILYRGFLLWLCTELAGVPVAVGLTTVVFGVVHLYQGPAGGLRAGAIGLVLALLTVFSGSIWLPMVLHAVLDLASGSVTSRSLQEAEEDLASPLLAEH